MGKKKGWSWNWPAFFTGSVWFFYRKLYLIGIGLLLFPVLLAVLIPQFADLNIGFAGALGITANGIYMWHAARKIEKLKKLNLSSDELKERVKDAGGTSPAGAVFGALILVAAMGLAFLESSMETLPGCDSPQVQELAGNMVKGNLEKVGESPEGLQVYNFQSVENQGDVSMNLCSYTAELRDNKKEMYLAVTWHDEENGMFRVRIGPTVDAVSK